MCIGFSKLHSYKTEKSIASKIAKNFGTPIYELLNKITTFLKSWTQVFQKNNSSNLLVSVTPLKKTLKARDRINEKKKEWKKIKKSSHLQYWPYLEVQHLGLWRLIPQIP